MTPNDKVEQAASMRSKGYSLSQIADEMEVSKSTVHRWLSSYDETCSEIDDETEDEDDSEDELEVPSTFRFHDEERPRNVHMERRTNIARHVAGTNDVQLLNALQGIERMRHENEMEKERLRNETQKEETERLKAQLKLEKKRSSEKKKQEPLRQKKKRLLKRFRNIVGYFVDYAQGYRWQRDDVLDFLERIDNLRERITEFATDQGVDPEELETVAVLSDLWDLIQYEYESHSRKLFASASIPFRYDAEIVEEFTDTLEISDLFTLASDVDEEDNGVEDDDY